MLKTNLKNWCNIIKMLTDIGWRMRYVTLRVQCEPEPKARVHIAPEGSHISSRHPMKVSIFYTTLNLTLNKKEIFREITRHKIKLFLIKYTSVKRSDWLNTSIHSLINEIMAFTSIFQIREIHFINYEIL